MAGTTNIKARRRLSALYETGVEIRFTPDGPRVPESGKGALVDENEKPIPAGPDDVQMWVQPPSPFQREMAMRDGQASRARALVKVRREKDSEEHLTVMAFLSEMTDETLVEYVLQSTADTRRQEALRDVLSRDEWKNFEELRDAVRLFEEMDEAEVALRQDEYDALMAEDRKLGDDVMSRENELADSEREAYTFRSRETLEKQALEKRGEIVGHQAFMYEYDLQMQFYACKEFDDHGVLFFGSAREMANEPEQVQDAIREALASFIADTGEAKNWLGAADGSEPSVQPNAPEISAPSIPEVATA